MFIRVYFLTLIHSREKIESDRAAEEYEIDRRINPRAPDDFKLILEELEKSNDEELARLKQTYKDDPLGLTTATLEQLVVLTSTRAKIDSKWHIVKKDRSEKKVMDELSQMATPHSWSLSGNLKGDKAVVDTPETIRAAELLLVMTELTENPSSDLERLQTLSLLREALSGSIKSQLLHDIYELVTREEDWLRRGRSDHLTQLRKRLLYLMKNYINCAEYNPAIAVESLFRNHK